LLWPDKDKTRLFGIYLDPGLARFGVVDGILALGKCTLASPRANTGALATAFCRKDFLCNQVSRACSQLLHNECLAYGGSNFYASLII